MCLNDEDFVWIMVLVLILIVLYLICKERNSSTPLNFNTFFESG